MSLYYEAASFLSPASFKEGSLKSCIFKASSNLKSNPATVYALLSETAKYDTLLTEIIDNAGILALEPKLTPVLSLLLVHDHLLSKKGIAATTNHPLRLAVERHKARLHAELTKSRIRRGCVSIEDLKKHVAERAKAAAARSVQPRWVRVNCLKSTVQREMSSTFSEYIRTPRLADVANVSPEARLVYLDQHVPDLIALPPGTEVAKTQAYKDGKLILQDKASCFPAFLLLGGSGDHNQGDILDACAAPGNKTTHLASILLQQSIVMNSATPNSEPKIFACERDPYRSQTLHKMMVVAGAESVVTILAKQDFLALDLGDARFKNVTHLLLDPSCSGSGIVGRDGMPALQLPKDPKVSRASGSMVDGMAVGRGVSKKRKRHNESEGNGKSGDPEWLPPSPSFDLTNEEVHCDVDFARLDKLATLQTKIIEHAFSFPAARRITYSTCSIHVQENEAVVSRALRGEVARHRGWRVMREEEQPDGMRRWPHRGLALPDITEDLVSSQEAVSNELEEERRACIRCHAGDEEGTMGFFVCGFIRETKRIDFNGAGEKTSGEAMSHGDDEEWEGFSNDEDVQSGH